jgi:hypothetical protein
MDYFADTTGVRQGKVLSVSEKICEIKLLSPQKRSRLQPCSIDGHFHDKANPEVMTENGLQVAFAANRMVTEASLMMNRATGRPRGFGIHRRQGFEIRA